MHRAQSGHSANFSARQGGIYSRAHRNFAVSFNDFLFAYIFVRPESLTTLAVGLGKMLIGDIFPFGKMAAASLMMAVPVTAV